MNMSLFDRPALLFMPASNARAIAKARALAPDVVILDLEDAVAPADKALAREAAVAAVEEAWPCPVAIRVNGTGSDWHDEDVGAVHNAMCDFVVLPMAEEADTVAALAEATGKPVAAMIESPRGVLAAPAIAGRAAALIVGTNDLAAGLKLPDGAGRASLSSALQLILLAARAHGIAAFDGVFNRIDDAEGFATEAREGRMLGYDGKSLIHPSQIDPTREAWAPTPAELERARRLVDAYAGGAERFEGAMVEAMHVEAARRLLERARR